MDSRLRTDGQDETERNGLRGRTLGVVGFGTSRTHWILVVEDDPDIAQLVCFNLELQGLAARSVADGEQALAVVQQDRPALIVLDLMLPGMSGFEICKRLRSDAATASLPIVILTARATEGDRMIGLQMGADDYVTKPFSPRELATRVHAALRRAAEPEPAHDYAR